MSNVMQNRINAVLPENEMNEIKKYITKLISLLPESGNLTLTENEKGQLASLDVDNKIFVEDALNELNNNGKGIMPEVIKSAYLENDLKLFEQMDELHSMLSKALQSLENLRRIAASEAYAVSGLIYKLFAIAAASGIPNAQSSYEKLKERYQVNGGGAKQQPLL